MSSSFNATAKCSTVWPENVAVLNFVGRFERLNSLKECSVVGGPLET